MGSECAAQFAAVLNTKKQRIAQLEERLADNNMQSLEVAQPSGSGSEGATDEPCTDNDSEIEEVCDLDVLVYVFG